MQIKERALYQGAALTQIVEYKHFKALNKADEKYGHYAINDKIRLLIKYSKSDPKWQFAFNQSDLDTLNVDLEKGYETFVALVCGDETVCCLDRYNLADLLDLHGKTTQAIYVTCEPRHQPKVISRRRNREISVPHNSFPDDLFK